MRKPIESISARTLSALAEYHWPGNVRELENVIERAVILSSGPELEVSLPGAVSSQSVVITAEGAEPEYEFRRCRACTHPSRAERHELDYWRPARRSVKVGPQPLDASIQDEKARRHSPFLNARSAAGEIAPVAVIYHHFRFSAPPIATHAIALNAQSFPFLTFTVQRDL